MLTLDRLSGISNPTSSQSLMGSKDSLPKIQPGVGIVEGKKSICGCSIPSSQNILSPNVDVKNSGFEAVISQLVQIIDALIKFLSQSSTVGFPANPGLSDGVGGATHFKAEEMLWKPKSSKDGKLAILLPKSVTGSVKEVKLIGEDGKLIEKGKEITAGASESGRINYRFKKPGGSYEKGLAVRVVYNNGKQQDIVQTDPARRTGK